MPEVIADTSPLQYLFQLGILQVLPDFYGEPLPFAVGYRRLKWRRPGPAARPPAFAAGPPPPCCPG